MSHLSEEFLRRWDADIDAGFDPESPFTSWWRRIVQRSIEFSENDLYTACARELQKALRYSVRATQSDIGYAPLALSHTMQAMELLKSCNKKSIPNNADVLDLEDLDQAIMLVAFQFDSIIGSDEWIVCLDEWFTRSYRVISNQIALGVRPVETIERAIDEGEEADLDTLDHAHWVLAMLEWFKLEDPRRNIGIDLGGVHDSLFQLEEDLRRALPNLRRAGAVQCDKLAPSLFWWRH